LAGAWCFFFSSRQTRRFGQERLSLLQDIAAAKATGKTGEAYHNSVKASVEKWMPLRHGNVEDVRKDVVSHFVLRLAFCAAQNRPWFITQEVLLLEHRLTAMGAKIPDFFADNALDYKPIAEELFEQLEEALKTVYYDCAPHNAANYYPVPFQEATQLLKGRRAFLVGGHAIVHAQKLVQIVSVHFKLELSRALATTAKAHHSFGQDERIAPLLGMWSNGYLSGTGTAFGSAGVIDLGKIDQIADAHYPLCMKHTHRALRANHHLMHNGRMQYGLFLKGIGVTLDDSVNFWRR
jgi:DNA primase large subunit